MRVRLPALVAVLLQAAGCGVALAQGVAISSGSGFIVSRSGEILTNFHVVKGCSSLTVQIGNDSTEKAELIARDETNDLAITRVDAAVNPVGAFRGKSANPSGGARNCFRLPIVRLSCLDSQSIRRDH